MMAHLRRDQNDQSTEEVTYALTCFICVNHGTEHGILIFIHFY